MKNHNSQDNLTEAKNSFDEKLSSKLKAENIKPYPRWRFLLKDYVVVAAGTVSLLIGAVAVTVMIYLFRNNDWDLQVEMQPNFWKFLLLTLPYFWIIFLGIFIFIIYYNFRHVRRGYRYSAFTIVSGGVLASVILGSIFYSLGLGQKIDDVLGAQAPFYERIMNRQIGLWCQPEEGFLMGKIIESDIGNNFNILDLEGEEWQIITNNIMDSNRYNNIPREMLELGEAVHLLGEIVGDHQFQLKDIRPVRSGRSFIKSRPRSNPKTKPSRIYPPLLDDDLPPPISR